MTFRFKLGLGLSNKKVYGEFLVVNEQVTDQYCQNIKALINNKGLSFEEGHNFDETGLHYSSITENTMTSENEKIVPGRNYIKQERW